MEDELRLSLLFAGTCFIIAVLAHGIWKIRKNTKPSSKPRVEPRQWADTGEEEGSQSEGFDELGIGQVRVVSSGNTQENSQNDFDASYEQDPSDAGSNEHSNASHTGANASKAKSFYASDNTDDSDRNFERDNERDVSNVSDKLSPEYETSDHLATSAQKEANSLKTSSEDSACDTNAPKEKVADKPKLYGSVVSNPKPHLQSSSVPANEGDGFSSDSFPEPPGFLLREGDDESASEAAASNQPSVSYSAGDTPVSHDEGNSQSAPDHKSPEIDDFSLDSPATQSVSGNIAETGRKETEHQVSEGAEVVSASGLGEQAKRFMKGKRSKPISRKRQEPKFGDDQMRIDFDDSAASTANAGSAESESTVSQENSMQNATDSNSRAINEGASEQIEQEVLVLNVKAPENDPIAGAALLPMLLTLGFKFGDQDIFHRHVNSNGKGPVLFSLANMFKPGIFDIDNLETFNTQGVSLFMILPIEGDPHQVFNMMHNAARKLADEFGGQVLDGRRSVLTKQGLQQYMEKIREFERKRMITRQ